MIEQRNLIVGFDLCNDYSQISCFNNNTLEPESICMSSDQTKYLIPTLLGIKSSTKEWMIGDDALNCEQSGSGIIINNLLSRVEQKIDTDVFGITVKPVTLLEKYIRKCLLLLKMYYPNNSIQKLVVTLKENTQIVSDAVYQALESLGLGKDRAVVQSHVQSYMYYALGQKKELWMNDIGLFEYDEQGLIYRQISINRNETPYLVDVTEKDLSQTLSYQMLQELDGNENMQYIFDYTANSVLHKQIVGTIYVTGKGFEGNWADEVLRSLCSGRRVFVGQNLYTKGACYAAKGFAVDHKFDDFIFLNKDMIMNNFYVHGYYDAKVVDIILVKETMLWYDVDESMDIILDEEKEITIYVKNIRNHEVVSYRIELEGLPQRPNKTTRAEVRIKFINKTAAVITIKDKGFGEFYPATSRIWVKEIVIQS